MNRSPSTTPAADRTPPFWLPREGIWFHTGPDAPEWWGYFSAAACGHPVDLSLWSRREDKDDEEEEADPSLVVAFGEEWHGRALLCEGGIPDGRSTDPVDGPWRRHPSPGRTQPGP
ncbi:hypothetical protein GXW83_15595 [Streptacidiphilus sp. PB12-B1b]|uniref:hypothetical protein n=1 Tax=Streptacidiphilus sp. PB12-B1b TaxID=2705012 RepID=UPI0015FD7DF5|nr:hypothetical protein [Streptacidiphilus sp. PB12-B1b]QMU76931.1 hypothetical protein GXW83_15595 [Streptacidiphilus sp. PB12-B1b]